MKNEQSKLKPIQLIKSSVNILLVNKVIMFPLVIVALFQLLILEVLYFYPRFPINKVLGPVITYYFPSFYMNYPSNFILLPKLFQIAQMPVYVFISSFFIAVTIRIIASINEDKKVKVSSEMKSVLFSYGSVILAALVSFCIVMAFFKGYGLLFKRASLIRSQSGIYYIIKRIIMGGAPYFNLFLSIVVSTVFAYVLPVIAIEKKSFFKAIVVNFKILFNAFWPTFLIVLIPSLLYVPVLLLRGSFKPGAHFPELSVILLVLSIMVMFVIDVIVYTSLTTIYLIKKETK